MRKMLCLKMVMAQVSYIIYSYFNGKIGVIGVSHNNEMEMNGVPYFSHKSMYRGSEPRNILG